MDALASLLQEAAALHTWRHQPSTWGFHWPLAGPPLQTQEVVGGAWQPCRMGLCRCPSPCRSQEHDLSECSPVQADASGTLEAVRGALSALPQEAVALRFLLASANDMTESDIDLADVSDAMIIGFNMEPSESVIAAAKSRGRALLGRSAACLSPLLEWLLPETLHLLCST